MRQQLAAQQPVAQRRIAAVDHDPAPILGRIKIDSRIARLGQHDRVGPLPLVEHALQRQRSTLQIERDRLPPSGAHPPYLAHQRGLRGQRGIVPTQCNRTRQYLASRAMAVAIEAPPAAGNPRGWGAGWRWKVRKQVRPGRAFPPGPPTKGEPLEPVHSGEGIGKGRAEVRSETLV